MVNINKVFYCNAWSSGFEIKITDRTKHPEVDLLPSEARDVYLKNDDVDCNVINRTSLVSVNGLIHDSISTSKGITVIEGNHCKNGDNHIGLIRFSQLGALIKERVTRDNLMTAETSGVPLREGAYIKLRTSLKGKTIVASIGGFLHVLDGVIDVVDNKLIKINMLKLPLVERYMSTKHLYPYTCEEGLVKDESINRQHFLDNDNLADYLTSGNTFIALLERSDLKCEHVPLATQELPGKYIVKQTFNEPLVFDNGLIAEYRFGCNNESIVLETQPVLRVNRRMRTTDYHDQSWVNLSADPAYYREYGDLRMLRLTEKTVD